MATRTVRKGLRAGSGWPRPGRRKAAWGGEGLLLFVVAVPGICWYVDGGEHVYILPAYTGVPGAVALRPNAPGGSYVQWAALPAGAVTVDTRALPLVPVPMDQGMAAPSVEIPWRPEISRGGVLDLSQDWRLLFRQPEALIPWGTKDPAFAEAQRLCERALGARPTLRTGPGRREMRVLYPQRAPAEVCYRLHPEVLDSPLARRAAALIAMGDLTLVGPDGWRATAGVDALGWRVLLTRAGEREGSTARTASQAIELLISKGQVWEVAPPAGHLGAARALVRG
jgi:hypothetical protein